MADDFPTDLPSYSCTSIAELSPAPDRRLALHVRRLSATTAGQNALDVAAVEQRVREILGDRTKKSSEKKSEKTTSVEKRRSPCPAVLIQVIQIRAGCPATGAVVQHFTVGD
eukprot:scaffold23972_cov60-Phaeocystis_antarctica.AAC.2